MLVETFTQKFTPSTSVIRKWADRHTGVGFDQLLLVEPCDKIADFAFRIFNADGSEAEQCGNGARCIARFAWERKLTDAPSMYAATGSGQIMRMEILAEQRVCVEMGIPSFIPEDIPFLCDEPADNYEIIVAEQNLQIGVVSIGNPHVVLRVEDLSTYPVAQIGRSLQSLPEFPQSVNAGFMQIENSHELQLRVFERGAGETMACGSGACAAVAVARLWGLVDKAARVKQRGGTLDIEWEKQDETLKMIGSAEHVYNGEIEYP